MQPTPPAPTHVLVVDDELEFAETLAEGLSDRGFLATATSSGRDAIARLERDAVDALVTDLRMGGVDGLTLLAESRRLAPQRPVIVMTAYGAIDTAVESNRQGAYHYLAKLLDVLERGVVRPIGDSRERAVDVRVIAATHRDLRRDVLAGRFREDLFYPLDVETLEVPPLRARLDDLPRLTEHFLQLAVARYPASTVRRVSAEAMARLAGYRFPGNVRELAHLVERGVLLGRAAELQPADLPAAVLSDAPGTRVPFQGEIVPVRELRRRYAAWALEQLGGHRTRTAERLGIDAKTLAKWLANEPDESGRT